MSPNVVVMYGHAPEYENGCESGPGESVDDFGK